MVINRRENQNTIFFILILELEVKLQWFRLLVWFLVIQRFSLKHLPICSNGLCGLLKQIQPERSETDIYIYIYILAGSVFFSCWVWHVPGCLLHPLFRWWRMMTSSSGNMFRITGPLHGGFTVHRGIPLTKTSDAELWCFLWYAPEQTFELTIEMPMIWDAIALIMTAL